MLFLTINFRSVSRTNAPSELISSFSSTPLTAIVDYITHLHSHQIGSKDLNFNKTHMQTRLPKLKPFNGGAYTKQLRVNIVIGTQLTPNQCYHIFGLLLPSNLATKWQSWGSNHFPSSCSTSNSSCHIIINLQLDPNLFLTKWLDSSS